LRMTKDMTNDGNDDSNEEGIELKDSSDMRLQI
jgi:hypothetical protein